MASFKAKFPVLQELFAKNHSRGPLAPPSGARVITKKKTGRIKQVRVTATVTSPSRFDNDNSVSV